MKVTCKEVAVIDNQATLMGIEKVTADTPDEIDIVIKSMGPAAILEHIGVDYIKKHFNLVSVPTIVINNDLNDGMAIEFCLGEKEYKLNNQDSVEVEVNEDMCMYFDIVKTHTD